MPSVRDWHVGWLAAVWLATPAVFVVLRYAVHAAVYEAELDGQRVVITSGLWSSGFASLVTGIIGAVCGLTLVVVTVKWVAGRTHRRRLSSMTEDPGRGPLI